MTFAQWFNLIEGCWWWLCAGIVFWQHHKWTQANKRMARVLCVSLVAFGISDFWEMNTGAWYRPWQLMLLNAVCVTTFVVLILSRFLRR